MAEQAVRLFREQAFGWNNDTRYLTHPETSVLKFVIEQAIRNERQKRK